MSEYQIMRWREIPSMVVARSGETTIKIMLASRFQEAIDDVVLSGISVESYVITPEAGLRCSPGWENDRIVVVRRL